MSTSEKQKVMIVGGFGHVGLPLGIALADHGYDVVLYDIAAEIGETIEKGEMPFIENGADEILKRVIGKSLFIAEDIREARTADIIVVTIGTPIDEYLNPKYNIIFRLIRDLMPSFQSDQTLIVRSTVYPGTTKAIFDFIQRKGFQIHVANCPERIVQGRAIEELSQLPQIVSGFSETAVDAATKLFQALGAQVITVDVEEAELTKLFANAWRYIQFSIANQFYMIAEKHGADFNKIYKALTYNYDRAAGFPRPGFCAGPCLLKDTLQLSAFYDNQFLLGQSAMMVNEGLPQFIVGELKKRMDNSLSGVPVGILGMAFKAEIDDIRDSLSYKLRKILVFHGAQVLCSDEYVRDESFVSAEAVLENCQALIVGVPHRAYGQLNVPNGMQIVDLWGILRR